MVIVLVVKEVVVIGMTMVVVVRVHGDLKKIGEYVDNAEDGKPRACRLFNEGAKYQHEEEELGHLVVDEPGKHESSNKLISVVCDTKKHFMGANLTDFFLTERGVYIYPHPTPDE